MKKLISLFFICLKVSSLGLGGGYTMFALFQEELVQKRKLIKPERFLSLFAIAQVFPGPIAINFVLLSGYEIGGVLGIIVSIVGVIIPPFFVILLFADFLLAHRNNFLITKFLKGARIATVAILLNLGIKLIIDMKLKSITILTILSFVFFSFIFNINSIFIVISGFIFYFIYSLILDKKIQ